MQYPSSFRTASQVQSEWHQQKSDMIVDKYKPINNKKKSEWPGLNIISNFVFIVS